MAIQNQKNEPNADAWALYEFGSLYRVSDIEKSKDFYSKILKISPTRELGDWAEFQIGKTCLCLQETKMKEEVAKARKENSPNQVILGVKNLREFEEYLSSLKVDFEKLEFLTQDGGKCTNVIDPDGNLVGFYEN